MYPEQMSQGLTLMDVLNYQTVTNASVSGALYIDMSKVRRAMYVIILPSTGAAGTLDGRLQSSSATSFATVHNISGTNLTQITASTTPSNNAIATIEVRADQVVNANSGDRYVRLQLTGGGNAITVAAIGLGGEGVQKPANANDMNSTYVSQRVVCNI